MSDPCVALDGEVLRLRREGRSFTRISRELGLGTPAEAQAVFARAVAGLSTAERSRIRASEKTRLDRLTARVAADQEATEEQRARQMASIERLRNLVADDT
jgi:hypothetical protein